MSPGVELWGQRVWTFFLELLAHIARLPSRNTGLSYPPGSSLQECLFPHILSSMGYSACGFIFCFTSRILCFPSQGREGPGSEILSGPSELEPGPPSGWPPSHPALSSSPSHRGWTSGPAVSGESVGVGCGQSRGEEEAASSWRGLCWERGVSVGMLGGRKSPDPPPPATPGHRKFCSIFSRAGWRHPAWGRGRVIDNPSRPPTQARAETTHTSLWERGLDRNPGQYTQAIQVFAFKNWKYLPLPTSPSLYALKTCFYSRLSIHLSIH